MSYLMTQEKEQLDTINITLSKNFKGYEAFGAYFNIRAIRPKAEAVFEVVLVSNEWDRYNTKILPNGFVGLPSTTEVRYNHGGVDTGAYLENLREVENYQTGEIINGQERILEWALVGEMHVPKTAEQRYRSKDGQVHSNGSLLEAMVTGKSKKVSVGFIPVEAHVYENDKITIYDCRNLKQAQEVREKEKQGVKIVYTKWDMPELSVLDTTSGQATSLVKQIRSLINNNMSNNKRYLNTLVKYQDKFGVITKEIEEGDTIIQTITYLDSSGEDTVTFNKNEDDYEDKPVYAEVGEYLLSITKPTATISPESRDINIEKDPSKPSENTQGNNEGDPKSDPEADTNKDGEISDEEMRSYIKEIKRSYNSPAMIKEKMDSLERMCGDLGKRMDDMVSAATQRKSDEEEIEAQRIRALNQNLAEIPDKIETRSSEKSSQLGDGVNRSSIKADSSLEEYRQTILKINNYV